MDESLFSLEVVRYGEVFTIDYYFHGYDLVHFCNEHDMCMDSWKHLGEPTYDSSNEEI